jgi:hypothetical protein
MRSLKNSLKGRNFLHTSAVIKFVYRLYSIITYRKRPEFRALSALPEKHLTNPYYEKTRFRFPPPPITPFLNHHYGSEEK